MEHGKLNVLSWKNREATFVHLNSARLFRQVSTVSTRIKQNTSTLTAPLYAYPQRFPCSRPVVFKSLLLTYFGYSAVKAWLESTFFSKATKCL